MSRLLKALVASTLLGAFTAGLMIPVLPLYLVGKGFNLLQLGGLFSVVALATIGVQILASRWRHLFASPILVIGLQSASVVAFPLYLFVQRPVEYALVAALAGFASAAASPGLQALIAESVPPEQRASAFARIGSAWSYSYACALVAGGLLLSVGYWAVFYVGCLASLLGMCVTMGIVLAGRPRRSRAAALPDDLRPLWEDVRASRHETAALQRALARESSRLSIAVPVPRHAIVGLRWVTLHAFLFDLSLAAYPVYFPIYLHRAGLPFAWVGVAVAASWLTFGLAQPLGAKFVKRFGRDRALIVTSLVVAVGLNLAMAFGSLPVILVAWTLLGVADGVGRPVTASLVARTGGAAGALRAFGWVEGARTAARLVGPLGIAVVIFWTGMQGAFAFVAALVALSILPLFLVSMPRPAAAPLGARPEGDAA